MKYTKQVQNFLKQPSEKQKMIVIYGPTGSWKTDMSIEIAKMLETEIISTDSRQIYKGMDIGTGKITEEEKQWIVHYMLDIIEPDKDFSVWDFKTQSLTIIQDLHKRKKIPMLVGWTGLYIDSLIFDFKLPQIPANKELRAELSKLSNQQHYELLQDIDPEYAKILHPNNRVYVERAIEVKKLTGKSKLEFREEKKLLYEVLFLHPNFSNREKLYEKINARVEQMFEIWLEQEVRWLIEKWYTQTDQGMRSIGYQEFFPYFNGEASREEVIFQIQQASRNYAKRQITWFSKYEKYKGEK